MRILRTAVVATLIVGCGRDSTAPAVINGTYTLRTLRNEQLPAVVLESTNYALSVSGGSVTINGDLTFSDTYTRHEYNNGIVTDGPIACTGRWEPSGQSPTGHLLINLVKTGPVGCYDTGVGEWDGRNQLTIAWTRIGTGVHRR